MEDLYAELSTNCTCENEDGTPSDDCFDCYEMDKDNFIYVLEQWKERQVDTTNTVRIDGRGLTWQGLSGYAITEFDGLLDRLMINGDFTLRLSLDGDTLKCSRTSHDEHGASFTFSFVEDED